ncbi:MAG: hypothetical protein IKZ06_03980, partial [Oscillospiraceae bacterium]|nr:hypothetical protein [Oscillospiraceae bacterium]
SMGTKASIEAANIVNSLRAEGFKAECDLCGRSVKAQMKYADKIGAKLSCIIGDSELENGKVTVKNMGDGSSEEVALDELIEYVYEAGLGDVYSALEGALGNEFSGCPSLNIPPEINF